MFISTGINDTPTIVGKAGIPLVNAAFLAVKFDEAGNIVPAGTGENALGLLIATTPENVAAGEDVTVQIKDVGLWKTGDAVAAGAELTPDASGKAVTATEGAFILAIALESAAAEGAVIKVQVIKAGYKAGGEVAPLTLAGLTDVDITDIQDGDAIVYDATAKKYVNKALALEDLSDVEITDIQDGDAIVYDLATTSYVNKALELGDLADVEITEPEGDGDSLKYDEASGKWVNVAEEG